LLTERDILEHTNATGLKSPCHPGPILPLHVDKITSTKIKFHERQKANVNLQVHTPVNHGTVPPDTLKLQFAESGVPEALSDMIRGLQGHSDPHDLCSMKIASNLIVSLLLGGESCGTSECVKIGWIGFYINRLDPGKQVNGK